MYLFCSFTILLSWFLEPAYPMWTRQLLCRKEKKGYPWQLLIKPALTSHEIRSYFVQRLYKNKETSFCEMAFTPPKSVKIRLNSLLQEEKKCCLHRSNTILFHYILIPEAAKYGYFAIGQNIFITTTNLKRHWVTACKLHASPLEAPLGHNFSMTVIQNISWSNNQMRTICNIIKKETTKQTEFDRCQFSRFVSMWRFNIGIRLLQDIYNSCCYKRRSIAYANEG